MSKEHDYLNNKLVVAKPSTVKSPLLFRLRRRSNIYYGIIQNNNSLDAPDEVPIDESDIYAVMPNDDIEPGVAWGAKIQAHFSTERVKPWGLIHYYRKLADAEKGKLYKTLKRVNKILQKQKLNFVIPLDIEIRPNTGAMAGFWRKSKTGSESVIGLCPKSWIEYTLQDLTHILCHEVGHPLWAVYMSKEEKARWVKLYLKYNDIKDVTTDDLKTALKEFKEANTSVKIFMKGMEAEQAILFKSIFKYIKDKHHIDTKFIDVLIDGGDGVDTLESIWPKTKIQLSEMKITVSKYATKNSTEFWCESFAYYLSGKEILDKSIIKRVKKSIISLQAK